MPSKYLFTSARLGFRNWQDEDLPLLLALNQDKEVMRYFPEIRDVQESIKWMDRMQQMYLEKGYCYYAVFELSNEDFVGVLGIGDKDFNADFTPIIDIGWRIHKKYWNKGYATEGAQHCLKYVFNTLKLNEIKALCPINNKASERVMQKIGMHRELEFIHPELTDYPELKDFVLYTISHTQL